MADDKKSDEYEYPPEEYYKGGEYIPPDESLEPEGPGRGPFLSRRLLAIVGLLVAIGIVYLIMTFTNFRRTADQAQIQPPTVAEANIPPTTSSPTMQLQPTSPGAQIPNPNQDAAIQQVAQQSQVNQQNTADLQNQIQQLQSQLNNVTNSIAALNNQIQAIANEIRAITIDRSLRGRELNLTSFGTAYQLKALVPGRAWLQSKTGTTTSVTIGDRLPGYGIIQMINVDQGIVTTSSGAVIQYGPRDS